MLSDLPDRMVKMSDSGICTLPMQMFHIETAMMTNSSAANRELIRLTIHFYSVIFCDISLIDFSRSLFVFISFFILSYEYNIVVCFLLKYSAILSKLILVISLAR